MILQHFTPNDFIVIKLNIDAHWIEVPLAKPLLFDGDDDDDDSNTDGKDHGKDNDALKLTKLVDTFYFKTLFYGCQNASILEKSFVRILTWFHAIILLFTQSCNSCPFLGLSFDESVEK